MLRSLKYEYLLFDFDGTLIDTNELIIKTIRETSKQFLTRDVTEEVLNSILGKPLEEQMKCLCPDSYKEMVLLYKTLYKSYHDEMIKEFPGIGKMLCELKKVGCKISIVSAKGRGGIENGLKHFNLQNYIDVIVSAYDIINNKPHPEPALKAINAMGCSVENALMIGDSPYDILCGKNAGIKTVLVDWTIFPKDELLKLQPDYCIKNPQELLEIIKL